MKNSLKYLRALRLKYPTIEATVTEIINLKSILNLPKGTEHFISDIHGAYEQMSHVLRNGSGAIKRKIQDEFKDSLSIYDKKKLASLIYYPSETIELIEAELKSCEIDDWYRVSIYRLIVMVRSTSTKYTRSKIRKAIPKNWVYIIEELLTEREGIVDKKAYYDEIINTIIDLGYAKEIIITLADLIKRLVIDHLHVIGDIYDRGDGAYKVMEELMNYHSIDVQWGNHDVIWMAAAAGQLAAIATVIRNQVRYGIIDLLEDDYGINILPLASFAIQFYKDDPCTSFKLKIDNERKPLISESILMKMHKAITIIQFKLEGQTILKRPEFDMNDRLLLDKIDYEKGTVNINGNIYELNDKLFPTIDPKNPYELTKEEYAIMKHLQHGFTSCHKLQEHIRFLMNKGSLYLIYNSNLLYHALIPLNSDGSLKDVIIDKKAYKGKKLYDVLEKYIRKGFFLPNKEEFYEEKEYAKDIMWYVWNSKDSPLFGKKKMATFERYFVKDTDTHVEEKTSYYNLIEDKNVINMILKEFGLNPDEAHIISGHMPVSAKKKEKPYHCEGKLFIIDGGFCKAYQKTTGVAGYTLTYNSFGLILVAHEAFKSKDEAVKNESDILSEIIIEENVSERKLVKDTDIGKKLEEMIEDLNELLEAYRKGILRLKG